MSTKTLLYTRRARTHTRAMLDESKSTSKHYKIQEGCVYSVSAKPHKKTYKVDILLSATEMKYFEITKVLVQLHNKSPLFLHKLALRCPNAAQIASDNLRRFCTVGDPTLGIGTGEDVTCLQDNLPLVFNEKTADLELQINTILFMIKEIIRSLLELCKKLHFRHIIMKSYPTYITLRVINTQLKTAKFLDLVNNNTIRSYMIKTTPKIKPIEEELFSCYVKQHEKYEYEYYKKQLASFSLIFKVMQPSDFFLASGKIIGWLSIKDIFMLKIYYCMLRYVPPDSIQDVHMRQTMCNCIINGIRPFLKACDIHISESEEVLCTDVSLILLKVMQYLEDRIQRYSASMNIIFTLCNLIPPPPTWLRFVERNK